MRPRPEACECEQLSHGEGKPALPLVRERRQQRSLVGAAGRSRIGDGRGVAVAAAHVNGNVQRLARAVVLR